MIKTIDVETDDNFESCGNCINCDDSEEISMTYELNAEMHLEKIIGESREVSQALNEFADKLEEIEKKYKEEYYTK